ncbi:hypothetical protein AACH06_29395 [Ideonella sp. DXS29W]|uniref:T6SS immunity protein Tdi1 C-terminal domain-containing protein n=1 Tax=Ideonella lacteola TaxID=2984193 RepID=A0ABU9C1L2_9BURK
MHLSDVLLHPSEYDCTAVEAPWSWLLASDVSLLHVSVFGHLFLSGGDGRIWLLDSWSGQLYCVGQSYEQHKSQVQTDQEFFETCFFADLVAALNTAGLSRLPGQVFAPYVSPGIGGSLTPENFSSAPIRAYAAISAAEAKVLRESSQ